MSEGRIGVLVSGRGRGTNFRAIARASHEGRIRSRVALLVATHAEHGALDAAREFQIPALVLSHDPNHDGASWEEQVRTVLVEHQVQCVALAGFMRHVGPTLLQAFPHRIANVHPSLLPAFGGEGMWGARVHEAVLEHGSKVSGCTVHLLDERYDSGPIIAQKCVPVHEDDTSQVLGERVQAAEHEIYPTCLDHLAHGELEVVGRCVRKVLMGHGLRREEHGC